MQDGSVTELDGQPPAITNVTELEMKIVARFRSATRFPWLTDKASSKQMLADVNTALLTINHYNQNHSFILVICCWMTTFVMLIGSYYSRLLWPPRMVNTRHNNPDHERFIMVAKSMKVIWNEDVEARIADLEDSYNYLSHRPISSW